MLSLLQEIRARWTSNARLCRCTYRHTALANACCGAVPVPIQACLPQQLNLPDAAALSRMLKAAANTAPTEQQLAQQHGQEPALVFFLLTLCSQLGAQAVLAADMASQQCAGDAAAADWVRQLVLTTCQSMVQDAAARLAHYTHHYLWGVLAWIDGKALQAIYEQGGLAYEMRTRLREVARFISKEKLAGPLVCAEVSVGQVGRVGCTCNCRAVFCHITCGPTVHTEYLSRYIILDSEPAPLSA